MITLWNYRLDINPSSRCDHRVDRQSCYMVRADELYNEVTQDASGKGASQGMFVGCFVDTATGWVSFTCEGKETSHKFKMEPDTKLFPAIFVEATSKAREDLHDVAVVRGCSAELGTSRHTAVPAQIEGSVSETSSMGQSAQSVASGARFEAVRHQRLVHVVRGRDIDAGSAHSRRGQVHRHIGTHRNGQIAEVNCSRLSKH